jgi:hypothetical protein
MPLPSDRSADHIPVIANVPYQYKITTRDSCSLTSRFMRALVSIHAPCVESLPGYELRLMGTDTY